MRSFDDEWWLPPVRSVAVTLSAVMKLVQLHMLNRCEIWKNSALASCTVCSFLEVVFCFRCVTVAPDVARAFELDFSRRPHEPASFSSFCPRGALNIALGTTILSTS